jgi:hypothetical protein
MTGKGKNRISTPEEWYRCRQPEILQMLQEYQCVKTIGCHTYTLLLIFSLSLSLSFGLPVLEVRD